VDRCVLRKVGKYNGVQYNVQHNVQYNVQYNGLQSKRCVPRKAGQRLPGLALYLQDKANR
jgi:hypothetical protein